MLTRMAQIITVAHQDLHLAWIDLLINPDCIPKTRSVWPTLLVKKWTWTGIFKPAELNSPRKGYSDEDREEGKNKERIVGTLEKWLNHHTAIWFHILHDTIWLSSPKFTSFKTGNWLVIKTELIQSLALKEVSFDKIWVSFKCTPAILTHTVPHL